MAVDAVAERLMAQITSLDSQLQNAVAVHHDLHQQLDNCIKLANSLQGDWLRVKERMDSLDSEYQSSRNKSTLDSRNALVPGLNSLFDRVKEEFRKHDRLDPAHADAKARMIELAEQKDRLLGELRARASYLESQKSTSRERVVQSKSEKSKVDVGRGFDRRTGQYTTDVFVIDRDPDSGSHKHIVISEDTGEVLFDEDRPDKKK